MKKNKMMRLASSLLVAVLLTTSVISGTFAKYVTEGHAEDTARVAKWGVVATVTGEAFKTSYEKKDTKYNVTAYSVVSTEEVLAPGTEGTFGGVTLSGSPEVAVHVYYSDETVIDIKGDWQDKAGNFYCPIQFNINGTEIDGRTATKEADLEKLLLDAVKKGEAYYAPNTDLSSIDALNGSYTWKWAFDADGNQTDAKDTDLGNWELNQKTKPEITFNVKVIVEQVD